MADPSGREPKTCAECRPAFVGNWPHKQVVLLCPRHASVERLVEALSELVAEFDTADLRAGKEPGCYGLNPTNGIEMARAALCEAGEPE